MIFRQLLRFGLVGALATLVHMLIGATLIHSGWPALGANPVSFVIAFVVSFMGHYGFSFSDQEVDRRLRWLYRQRSAFGPAHMVRRGAADSCSDLLDRRGGHRLFFCQSKLGVPKIINRPRPDNPILLTSA